MAIRLGKELIEISKITTLVARKSIAHIRHPYVLEIEKKDTTVLSYPFFGTVQKDTVLYKFKYENIKDSNYYEDDDYYD